MKKQFIAKLLFPVLVVAFTSKINSAEEDEQTESYSSQFKNLCGKLYSKIFQSVDDRYEPISTVDDYGPLLNTKTKQSEKNPDNVMVPVPGENKK